MTTGRGARASRLPRLRADAGTLDGGRAANEAKHEKLHRRLLERRARTYGLTLRHSSNGYSLIDASRNRADGRNDMTLRDVELHLNRL